MIVHRFLLVSLSIEAILGETTIHRRRERLKRISCGQDVGDVYTATLERIRTQGEDRARLGMDAIMWIAYSEQPLEPEELCQVLGVEIGSADVNSDNAPSIRTILNCGLGLVTVDSSSSKVRLVHFTLQEYILANAILFPSPHSVMAEVCLTYLNFECFRDLSPALSQPLPTTPFLWYASRHWGAHARRETSECVISLALKLLDQFDTHISCEIFRGTRGTGFTGLHAAAFMGVGKIMDSLLKAREWDLNATESLGNTALALATGSGHSGIVQLLLEQEGVDPNIADPIGRTPLSMAINLWGREEILEMLLQRDDVNPNTVFHGSTPLLKAVRNGSKRGVELLLQRGDTNLDTKDDYGRTPLWWAAKDGCAEIAEMLLERNHVNPNTIDYRNMAPLSVAAKSGHKGIVKMLLERSDVNPNTADHLGRTPLSWAAQTGHNEIAKMLLKRSGTDPDRAGKGGQTLFPRPANNGGAGVVYGQDGWHATEPPSKKIRRF